MKKILILSMLCLFLEAGAPKSGTTTCPSSGSAPINTLHQKSVTYTIQADINNAGYVCWGDPSVTTSAAPCLASFMSYTAQPQGNAGAYDLSTVWFACTVNTDVVKWSYQ